MVQEVHILIGVPPSDFQRHYNLAPWRDDEHLRMLEATASLYARKMAAGAKGG
ncbi:MAG TPA: hypothetical protein VNO24_27610 [Blastocatellia bacterium]|nr:hypothetical protein [Blastocatellia bacterium]